MSQVSNETANQMVRTPHRLSGRIYAVPDIGEAQISELFALFTQYYEGVSLKKFKEDLSGKSHVIILRDRANEAVAGFTTIQVWEQELEGRSFPIVFSGDTVVDRAYWGQKELQKCFGQFLWRLRLRYPFKRLFWFPISKGYKTYLLIVNSFPTAWPQYKRPFPAFELRLKHALGHRKFPDEYDEKTGIIRYKELGGQVKDGVADITPDLLDNPHIRYFYQKNPRYDRGDELACLVELTWGVLLRAIARVTLKRLQIK